MKQISGKLILLGQPHLAHRLAIAFGMGTSEVTGGAFLVRAAFLMSDHQHFESIQLGEASQHRAVITEVLVAVQLHELVKGQDSSSRVCRVDSYAAQPGPFARHRASCRFRAVV